MTKAIDNEVQRIMRKVTDVGRANHKFSTTKEPNAYKKWSNQYDALEAEIQALVERANGLTTKEIIALTPDELEQVAGGYGDSGHAGGKKIDN